MRSVDAPLSRPPPSAQAPTLHPVSCRLTDARRLPHTSVHASHHLGLDGKKSMHHMCCCIPRCVRAGYTCLRSWLSVMFLSTANSGTKLDTDCCCILNEESALRSGYPTAPGTMYSLSCRNFFGGVVRPNFQHSDVPIFQTVLSCTDS